MSSLALNVVENKQNKHVSITNNLHGEGTESALEEKKRTVGYIKTFVTACHKILSLM